MAISWTKQKYRAKAKSSPPKALREELRWAKGQRLQVAKTVDGALLKAIADVPRTSLDQVADSLSWSGAAKTLEEMDVAIAEAVRESFNAGKRPPQMSLFALAGQKAKLAVLSLPKPHSLATHSKYILYKHPRHGCHPMQSTKVFQSGNSQAVRIPSSLKLDAQEVSIERFGEGLLIRPLRNSWANYFATLSPLEDYPNDIPAAADNKPGIDFDS